MLIRRKWTVFQWYHFFHLDRHALHHCTSLLSLQPTGKHKQYLANIAGYYSNNSMKTFYRKCNFSIPFTWNDVATGVVGWAILPCMVTFATLGLAISISVPSPIPLNVYCTPSNVVNTGSPLFKPVNVHQLLKFHRTKCFYLYKKMIFNFI